MAWPQAGRRTDGSLASPKQMPHTEAALAASVVAGPVGDCARSWLEGPLPPTGDAGLGPVIASPCGPVGGTVPVGRKSLSLCPGSVPAPRSPCSLMFDEGVDPCGEAVVATRGVSGIPAGRGGGVVDSSPSGSTRPPGSVAVEGTAHRVHRDRYQAICLTPERERVLSLIHI